MPTWIWGVPRHNFLHADYTCLYYTTELALSVCACVRVRACVTVRVCARARPAGWPPSSRQRMNLPESPTRIPPRIRARGLVGDKRPLPGPGPACQLRAILGRGLGARAGWSRGRSSATQACPVELRRPTWSCQGTFLSLSPLSERSETSNVLILVLSSKITTPTTGNLNLSRKDQAQSLKLYDLPPFHSPP